MNAHAAPLTPGTMLVGPVLYGADDLVAAMVQARLGMQRDFGPFQAIGVVRQGVLLGGVVYHNYHGHSIEVSLAFDNASWALPQTMRALFAYPFIKLGVVRMEAMISRKNSRARKFIKGLGFTEEGCHPKKYNGVEDAVSYGMLRSSCRWIKGIDSHVA